MYPILGRFGSHFIYSFTVVLGLGVLVALGLAWRDALRQGRAGWAWLDAALIFMVAGLIGGRILFVALHWEYYQENQGEILLVGRGGVSYHGALLAALLTLWLWNRLQGGQHALTSTLDLYALPLIVAAAFGWVACWLEGCVYGRQAAFGLLAADLPDDLGVFDLRYRSQLFGLLLTLGVGLVIVIYRRWWPWKPLPGQLFWLALLLLSAVRLSITFLRGDPVLTLADWRVDSLAELLLLLVAVTAIVMISRARRSIT